MREIFVNPLVITCDICVVAVLTDLLITLKLCLIVRDIFCIAVLIDLDTLLILFVILAPKLFKPDDDALLMSSIVFFTAVATSANAVDTDFLICSALLDISFARPLKSPLASVSIPPICDLTSLAISPTLEVTPDSNPVIASIPSISSELKSSRLIFDISPISLVTPAFMSAIASAPSILRDSKLSIPSNDMPLIISEDDSVISFMLLVTPAFNSSVDATPPSARAPKSSWPFSDTSSIASLASSAASFVPFPKNPRNLFQAFDIKLATPSNRLPNHSNLPPSHTTTATSPAITAIIMPIGLVKNTNTAPTILIIETNIVNTLTITPITTANPAITPAMTAITCITVIIQECVSIKALIHSTNDATTPTTHPISCDITPIKIIKISINTWAPGCIASQTPLIIAFMFSQIATTLFLKSSLVCHRYIIAATTIPMVATIAIRGRFTPIMAPLRAPKTVVTAWNPDIICGTNPINKSKPPPTISKIDVKAVNIAIFCLVVSDNPLNHSTSPFIHSATSLIAGIKALPIDICIPSNAELNSVSAPLRLSICISAISCAVPPALYNSLAKLLTASAPCPAMALNAPSACSPNSADNAASLCSSDIFSVALIISDMTSGIGRISPLASYSATVCSPTANAPSSAFFFKSRSIALSAVPALDPDIPASPNTPINAAVCSMSIPAAEALAPAYCNA